jgi:hypothetical protein
MKPLILMYVFYDKNGDIKAITPVLNDTYAADFSVATFPLSEVEMFLTAQKNTFDYQVKVVEKITGITYSLVKKQLNINYTRTLNTYLTKVDEVLPNGNSVIITNDTVRGGVFIEVNKALKEVHKQIASSEEQEDVVNNFFNSGPSIVYLTKENNPYHLLFSFSFLPKTLFSVDKLYFPYKGSYTNTSAYTKKIIVGYGFKEK